MYQTISLYCSSRNPIKLTTSRIPLSSVSKHDCSPTPSPFIHLFFPSPTLSQQMYFYFLFPPAVSCFSTDPRKTRRNYLTDWTTDLNKSAYTNQYKGSSSLTCKQTTTQVERLVHLRIYYRDLPHARHRRHHSLDWKFCSGVRFGVDKV